MSCVPELRFKEFSDEWEEKKLEEIANINPKSENLPNNFIYIDLESVENGILKQKNLISKKNAPSRAQRILEINDILFQTVRPYQKNNLFFIFDDDFYVSSTGYAQLRAIGNPNFLFQIIHKEKFVNEVLKRCTGTSYPAINSSDLKQISVKFPSLEEQEKIANFLSKVDEKIAILEDKLQLWEIYKKGIMQQLFSQELRFTDDNGNSYPDWEEKKLGELFKIIAAGDMKKENFSENQTTEFRYPLYGNALDNKGLLGYSNLKKYPADSITLTARGNIGISFLRNRSFNAIGRLLVLIKKNEFINNKFFSNYINSKLTFFIESTGVPQLTSPSLQIYKSKYPSLEEQEKIANFLENLDQKIQNIDIEIKNNQTFKKGLLKKMFC